MVDILRVHVRRVTIAVFRFYRKINRLIDVVYTHDRQNRHHQFFLNEGMLEIRFANNATNLRPYLYADFFKKHCRVSTNAFTADRLFHDARLGIFNVHKHDACKLCRLLCRDFIRAVFQHFRNQLVRDITESKYFFLRNTRQIIIERTSVDDVLTCFLDIRRIVYDYGRVTRACADCFLTARKYASYYPRAARTYEQANVGVLVHDLCGVEGGFYHRRNEHLRTACHRACAVDKVYCIVRGCDRVGVGIEYHTVACCDHADTVTNYRFRRVGTGGDAADYAKRSHFRQGQAVIPCLCVRYNIHRTGGFIRYENMLRRLVRYAAHLRFRNAEVCHDIRFLSAKLTNVRNYLFTFFKGHSAYRFITRRSGVDCVVHVRVNADESTTVILRRVPTCFGNGCAATEVFDHRSDYFLDLGFSPVNCHFISPLRQVLFVTLLRLICRALRVPFS